MERYNLEQRFDVKKVIGRGTYGRIYLAEYRDEKLRSRRGRVAVKRIECVDFNMLNDAMNEILQMQNLLHDNIIRYHETFLSQAQGEEEIFINIVMELIEGGDLQIKFEKKKKIEEDFIIDLIEQVSTGLEFLHTKNIIHRDISPKNIMIVSNSEENIFKIVDFGFVRKIEKSLAQTLGVGTFFYLSPELMEQRPYGVQVDIWSLGAVILNLMDMKEKMVLMHLLKNDREKIMKALSLRRGYSKSLIKLVMDMLIIDEKERVTSSEIVTRIKSIKSSSLKKKNGDNSEEQSYEEKKKKENELNQLSLNSIKTEYINFEGPIENDAENRQNRYIFDEQCNTSLRVALPKVLTHELPLPHQIMVEVFQYLRIPEISTMACVCQYWRVITLLDDLWRPRFISEWKDIYFKKKKKKKKKRDCKDDDEEEESDSSSSSLTQNIFFRNLKETEGEVLRPLAPSPIPRPGSIPSNIRLLGEDDNRQRRTFTSPFLQWRELFFRRRVLRGNLLKGRYDLKEIETGFKHRSFAVDEEILVIGDTNGRLLFYDVENEKHPFRSPVRIINAHHHKAVRGISILRPEGLLLSCGEDSSVQVRDLHTYHLIHELRKSKNQRLEWYRSILYYRPTKRVFVGDLRYLRIFSLDTKQRLIKFEKRMHVSRGEGVYSITLGPLGKRIFVRSDRTIRVYSVNEPYNLLNEIRYNHQVWGFAVDEKELFMGTMEKDLIIWSVDNANHKFTAKKRLKFHSGCGIICNVVLTQELVILGFTRGIIFALDRRSDDGSFPVLWGRMCAKRGVEEMKFDGRRIFSMIWKKEPFIVLDFDKPLRRQISYDPSEGSNTLEDEDYDGDVPSRCKNNNNNKSRKVNGGGSKRKHRKNRYKSSRFQGPKSKKKRKRKRKKY